jgi:hypothetical protein
VFFYPSALSSPVVLRPISSLSIKIPFTQIGKRRKSCWPNFVCLAIPVPPCLFYGLIDPVVVLISAADDHLRGCTIQCFAFLILLVHTGSADAILALSNAGASVMAADKDGLTGKFVFFSLPEFHITPSAAVFLLLLDSIVNKRQQRVSRSNQRL